MVAYNFQMRFEDKVRRLLKRQTIRPRGKRRHARVGERLQLYVGQRTAYCRKVVDPDPVCTESLPVRMGRSLSDSRIVVTVGGRELTAVEMERLARRDGFRDFDEMWGWFRSNHDEAVLDDLVLIRWKPWKEAA